MTRTMRGALTEALHELMAKDDDTIMLGEALATRGGASEITYGFLEQYGPNRVIETPISENALVGMALGAAVAGLPVIAEVYSADFIFCAGSEVVNDIAKWRYQHQWSKPLRLVLRMPTGSAGKWSGPEHTQAIEGLLQNVPGIRILVPSNADDAAAALVESLGTGDPVIFLEHRSLYDVPAPVGVPRGGSGTVSAGRVVRLGDDVTIVAWGAMREVAEESARCLQKEGISVELVDPVTVKPMNFGLIQRSVAKTGSLLVVDEGPRTGGVAGEVIARCVELTAGACRQARRVTFPDIHHPFDPDLERQVTPGVDDVCATVRAMLAAPQADTA